MRLSKNKLNVYSSLASAKMRKKYGLFVVEGEKSIIDTIDYFEVEAIVRQEGEFSKPLKNDCPVFTVPASEMKKISNLNTPPSVLAIYKINADFHPTFGKIEKKLYVAIDGVQDPGNFGTILRTCHWFGIFTVFASKDTVDLYNPKTIQSTMGSFAKVKVIYCDLEDLFGSNPEMPVYGLMLDGSDIFKAKLEDYGFILFGNEGNGISEKLRNSVTHSLLIPPATSDHSESLNVSVAAGITLSQFIK